MDFLNVIRFKAVLLALLLLFSSPVFGSEENWQQIINKSKNQTVDWYMWGGSPAVNSYVNGYLAPALKEQYGIRLRQVPVKDIGEIVSKLVVEKQAGKTDKGSVDLMWINGENFRTCKSNNLLFGPFGDQLPNSDLVDWENPAIQNDFGTPVEYMESPWGSAQLVMIYDSARLDTVPRTISELLSWIKNNPGRFSYPAPPDFTGSAFIRHIFYHASRSVDMWQADYSEEELNQALEATYRLLKDIKPYLWRKGITYPDSPVRMNNLFADKELDFSFSYNQGEASRNIHDRIFADTVRTFVFDEGTLTNTHFVAIPFNAEDKEGAMVVANFLLSPKTQLKKFTPEIWGDFPVIDISRLTEDDKTIFDQLPQGIATLSPDELQKHQLPELPSEILVKLEKGWKENVLLRK